MKAVSPEYRKRKKYFRQYQKEHSAEINEYNKEWRKKNPGKAAAYNKKWRHTHPIKSKRSHQLSLEKRKLRPPAPCHPERPLYGRTGMCQCCHKNAWRRKNIERARQKGREFREKHKERLNAINRVQNRERYQKMTPEERRLRLVRQVYGITKERFHEMYEKQNRSCLICLQPFDLRKLIIEHDHRLPRKQGVRGLTCQPCNLLIGMMENKSELILRVIEYVNSKSQLFALPIIFGDPDVED